MNAMTNASTAKTAALQQTSPWASLQTVFALAALALAVMFAGLAVIVAAVAVPVGLAIQAIAGQPRPKRRRGWQQVTA